MQDRAALVARPWLGQPVVLAVGERCEARPLMESICNGQEAGAFSAQSEHMRYRLHGIEIRSENSAKPAEDAAAPLLAWLRSRNPVRSALDYGCGKLRYARYVAGMCTKLGIVDSRIQLDRSQRISGRLTTVRQYAHKTWPGVLVYDLESFWKGIPERYDFVLCANVLSAIPCPRVRAKSLRAVSAALSATGELLVVNQHTNSYFGMVKSKADTLRHLNGWILQSRSGGAYYGILNKATVIELLCRHGFAIIDAWIDGQSNYVLARRNER